MEPAEDNRCSGIHNSRLNKEFCLKKLQWEQKWNKKTKLKLSQTAKHRIMS